MKQTRGFTLIEMAIVLVIITILIGGLVMPLSAQIQARRIAETNRTLEEARDAIIGYAMTHKTISAHPYLPCPDTDGDGKENRSGDECLKSYGFFPWVDIGSAPSDAWGNRLGYVVESQLADKAVGFSSATIPPDPPTSGWKQIAKAQGCATIDVAAGLPFLLISHGPNGWGARNVNGNTLADPTGPDEIENLSPNPVPSNDDGCYVSRVPSKPGGAGGEFDDLVTWLPFGTLFSRACPSGCP